MAQSSSAGRVRRRRDKLRELGMRPVQVWVPDTRAPGFAEELARQARLVSPSVTDADLSWLDDAADDLLDLIDERES